MIIGFLLVAISCNYLVNRKEIRLETEDHQITLKLKNPF